MNQGHIPALDPVKEHESEQTLNFVSFYLPFNIVWMTYRPVEWEADNAEQDPHNSCWAVNGQSHVVPEHDWALQSSGQCSNIPMVPLDMTSY